MELLKLITDYRDWLKYFTRRDYASHFAQYKAAGYPVIATLEDPVQAAEDLLNALEADWAKAGRKRRVALARETDKMLICMFFNLMAMDLPCRSGPEIANALCTLFNQRYPNEAYRVGTYEMYMEGFKPTIFGLRIGK